MIFTHWRTRLGVALFSLGMAANVNALEFRTIDTEASNLSFRYSQMNVNMDGGFNAMQVQAFSFDPAKPEDANIVIEIPVKSIDAGYSEANAEIGKDIWLNADAHPAARFESTGVEAIADDQYKVTGTLSIKGQSRDITVPVNFKQEGEKAVFDGSFTFNREDFAIGEGEWMDFSIVANAIEVKFHIVARP